MQMIKPTTCHVSLLSPPVELKHDDDAPCIYQGHAGFRCFYTSSKDLTAHNEGGSEAGDRWVPEQTFAASLIFILLEGGDRYN